MEAGKLLQSNRILITIKSLQKGIYPYQSLIGRDRRKAIRVLCNGRILQKQKAYF